MGYIVEAGAVGSKCSVTRRGKDGKGRESPVLNVYFGCRLGHLLIGP